MPKKAHVHPLLKAASAAEFWLRYIGTLQQRTGLPYPACWRFIEQQQAVALAVAVHRFLPEPWHSALDVDRLRQTALFFWLWYDRNNQPQQQRTIIVEALPP